MSFGNPVWLLGLLALPLSWLAYRHRSTRARRYVVRLPAAATLALAAPVVPAWRRHLPAALALAAMLPLVLALAHPQAAHSVAVQRATIVLVTDHSGSMQAQDVQPTRLVAAENAAGRFIDTLPAGVQLGIVTYSAGSDAVQAPTTDHELIRRIVDGQQAEGATATGDALQVALGMLRQTRSDSHAAIVLLSDGTTTSGSDPVPIAAQAGQKKIPIYTVALGTADATVPNPDPYGPPLSAAPDPVTLQRIAQVSGAHAFQAGDSARLNSIYQQLGARLGSRHVTRQLTSGFAIAGLALLLGALAASQLRGPSRRRYMPPGRQEPPAVGSPGASPR
jgi:Ca-activated chloride channel family protein